MDDPQNRGGGYEKVNNLVCSLTVLYCQLPRLCESWNRTNVHSENYRNFNKSMVRCHNSSLCSTEFLLHSTGREKSATSRCSQRAWLMNEYYNSAMFLCRVRCPWSSSRRELLSLAKRILTACTLMRSLYWRYFILYNWMFWAFYWGNNLLQPLSYFQLTLLAKENRDP